MTFGQNKDWCFLGTWEGEKQLLKVIISTKNDRDKAVNLLTEYLVNNLQIYYKFQCKYWLKIKLEMGRCLVIKVLAMLSQDLRQDLQNAWTSWQSKRQVKIRQLTTYKPLIMDGSFRQDRSISDYQIHFHGHFWLYWEDFEAILPSFMMWAVDFHYIALYGSIYCYNIYCKWEFIWLPLDYGSPGLLL